MRTYPAVLVALLTLVSIQAAEAPPYRDSKRPIAERVEDLLGRMTIEEKIAQLRSNQSLVEQSKAEKKLNLEEAAKVLRDGIGTIAKLPAISSLLNARRPCPA